VPLRDGLSSDRIRAAGRRVTVRVIAPPFACVGTGVLRIVRVAYGEWTIAVDAAYEGYGRL